MSGGGGGGLSLKGVDLGNQWNINEGKKRFIHSGMAL